MKYDFNQQTMTLTVSTNFLKKAGKFNSPEYTLIKRLRADYPTLTVEVAEKRKSSMARLTYTQMEGFITEVEKDALSLFEKVKKISKVQKSPYAYVRNWFEARYPHYAKLVSFDENGKMIFGKQEAERQEEEGQEMDLKTQIQTVLTSNEEVAA